MELMIKNLTKAYSGKKAVDRFSTTLPCGLHGLLGANGSGKTTLMRMLADVLRPTDGEIFLDGISIKKLGDAYRENIGYLPQQFDVYSGFTAKDFMLCLAAAKGIEKKSAEKMTADLLQKVGLEKVENHKVSTFSGGMKQRLGIAQALINNPKILILDEPTAGLDPKERIRLKNLLSTIAADRIILLSTHIVSDVEELASDILMMREGRLIEQGNVEKIAALAAGKVWRIHATPKEADKLQVSHLVSSMRRREETVELRIVSESRPTPEAILAEPTLDDVYLYCFGEDDV